MTQTWSHPGSPERGGSAQFRGATSISNSGQGGQRGTPHASPGWSGRVASAKGQEDSVKARVAPQWKFEG